MGQFSRITPGQTFTMEWGFRFKGSCALSVQANRHTPFANRRMKFYARSITETQRARLKKDSLAATSPGV